MRPITRTLLAALLLGVPLAAAPTPLAAQAQQAERVEPRVAASAIAQLIEDNYFSVERGAAIAGELRQRTESGAFDRYTNPYDLATALTATLQPHDAHFNVRFGGPPAGVPVQGAAPRAPIAGEDPAARANYGFRRVEMLPGRIGYIALDQFANFDPADANAPAKRAADAAMTFLSGAEAYIIDVRDNGGGSPVMVGYLSAYFTPEGADIFNTFHSRSGTRSEAPRATPAGARELEAPVYVLTSGRTGSAAEAFAYTLQSAGRAQTVGAASGGAANPGGGFPTPQGFVVFISTGSPINPITGRNWEGTGVSANVDVPVSEALHAAHMLALEATLRSLSGDAATETQWTLEAMRGGGPTLSARELRAYAGAYGERTVVAVNGALEVRFGRRPPSVLIPLERDIFTIEGRPLARVRFDRNAQDQIEAYSQLGPQGVQARFLRTN
jgi:hypothetical protein